MLLIGLTGSIATGKSTVSHMLAQPPYNLPIIDADVLARRVVEPGTSGYKKIVDYFGSTTPDLLMPVENDSDGSKGSSNKLSNRPLNRAVLGRRVFGSDEERKRDRAVLNGIVHPAVRRAIYQAIATAYVQGRWAVVLDVPLLFEAGLDGLCGTVLVVGVRNPAVQMQRLRDRDPGLSEEEVRDRVGSQGGVAEKVERCRARGSQWGEVLWNDMGREELQAEVARVMTEIKATSPSWWGKLLWVMPPLAMTMGIWCVLRCWWVERKRRLRALESQSKES